MSSQPAWRIRPFSSSDKGGLLRLWSSVSFHDGTVAARSAEWLDAMLEHPRTQNGRAWYVAEAGKAVVGALEVQFLGKLRTEVAVVVDAGFRRQGIASALIRKAPYQRRLLIRSRSNTPGAGALLSGAGFEERYREVRLRRRTQGLVPLKVPSSIEVVEDRHRDVDRFLRCAASVFGEEFEQSDDERNLWQALLWRTGCRLVYMREKGRDIGLCLGALCDAARKQERDAGGVPTVGVIEKVGLIDAVRGRGLSRPLVRAGCLSLAAQGLTSIEASVDMRRPSAMKLYSEESFAPYDEDILWMRAEGEPFTDAPPASFF